MSPLDDLWLRIRYSPAFASLPEVVQESPWILLVGLILGLILWVILWRRFRGALSSRQLDRAASRQLKQEIRDCVQAQDWLGAGQRFEALGKVSAALDVYLRGGHDPERVDLLLRTGKRKEAKAIAQKAGVWTVFGELCEEDGEFAEAGAAHERAGHPFAAGRCFEQAEENFLAADCYLRAGLTAKAIELLEGAKGREGAVALESAVRAALAASSGEPNPEVVTAIGRCSQLWLEAGEPQQAYRLALDSERWDIAVPIARDHLSPSAETADLCARRGHPLAAAEIYKAIGQPRNEALARAEFYEQHEKPGESAQWYEVAEEWSLAGERWAEAGEAKKAAESLARAGEHRQAADLFGQIGDLAGQVESLRRAEAANPQEEKSGVLPDRNQTESLEDIKSTQRYLLQAEIGRGGMGVVYRAEDLVLRRRVAFKRLDREKLFDTKTGESLLAEARAVAQLSHPNIVQVYDAGRTEAGFFIVMELVDGKTFAELIEQGKLSVQAVVKVGRQISSALAHAHGRRIIHRDLKPSNLLWAEGRRVKLTDFGLARALDESSRQVLTRPAGTPFYMAPEQSRGEPVDQRTDIYSLGCVLFEMLCRRGPFEGQGNSIFHHLNTEPCDPRDFRLDVPESLGELILRCLNKKPEERPSSATLVSRELAAVESSLN